MRDDEEQVTTTLATTTTSENTTTTISDTTTTISENTTTISENTTITEPTTTIENTTSTTNSEEGSDNNTILIATLTAVGAILLIIFISLSIFMYIRGKRRKIVGSYNPAYLEDAQQAADRKNRHKMPYIIPLPNPERLI